MTGQDNDSNVTSFHRLRPANDHVPSHEPILRLPPTVKMMSLLLLGIFMAQYFAGPDVQDWIAMTFGFIPARYSGGIDFDWRAVASPVTYMFVHGSWLHVGMNIAMLAAFGGAIEKTAGSRKMLAIYFIGGVAAVFFHFLFYSSSPYPVIGASGGVSALFGAVIFLMHRQGMMGQGPKPLFFMAGAWIVISLFFGFTGIPGENAPVAWTAHIGGFLAGLALVHPVLLARK